MISAISMYKSFININLVLALSIVLGVETAAGSTRNAGADENPEQVRVWNRFANALYALHKQNIAKLKIKTEETAERYGGMLAGDGNYRNIRYYDENSGRLLSRIEWEPTNPPRIMVIEVNQYDTSGRLDRDYVAAYLPVYHNAPFQTLINIHHQDKTLKAYRQFDASGQHIYEQCEGALDGQRFSLSLEEYMIPSSEFEQEQIEPKGAYWACFGFLPERVDSEITELLALVADPNAKTPAQSAATTDEVQVIVDSVTEKIKTTPNEASLYLKRGDAYLLLQQFEQAIIDYDQAIKLDDGLDQAYFGRGMARGRTGRVRQGIEDLSVYIKRHPDSSLAYTKRGVRYLWIGNSVNAKRDMQKALELDPNNAEAHDDLGVIHARAGEYQKAEGHFKTTIRLEPSYQKAYHNLALVYFLSGNFQKSLDTVDRALAVRKNSRESLALKSEVLAALGRNKEAQALKEQAEFMPSVNWTEQLSVQ